MVVKPETLSKKALTTVNSPPNNRKGKAPKTQAATQQPVTMRKPSSTVIFSCGFVVMMAKKPLRSETMPEKTKGLKLSSMPFLKAMNAEINMSKATPIKEKPA